MGSVPLVSPSVTGPVFLLVMMLFVPSGGWETGEIQPQVYDEVKAHFDNEVKEGYGTRDLGY